MFRNTNCQGEPCPTMNHSLRRPYRWLFPSHRASTLATPPLLDASGAQHTMGLRLQDSWEALHHLHPTPHGLEASMVSFTFGFLSTDSSQLGSRNWLERPTHQNQGQMCCSKGMRNQAVQGKGTEDVIPPATHWLSLKPSQCLT